MRFEKTHLDDIVRCYCTSHIEIDDQLYAFFASENPNSECYSYTGEHFENKEVVWKDDRGGCMFIIPFKERKIDPSELMAFGDNGNDLSMLEMAGISVAMDNSSDDIKEKCDFVCKDNNHNGVSSFLIDYFKL